jgi:hypothetical protein
MTVLPAARGEEPDCARKVTRHAWPDVEAAPAACCHAVVAVTAPNLMIFNGGGYTTVRPAWPDGPRQAGGRGQGGPEQG